MGGVTGGDGEDAEETVGAMNQEDLTADVEDRVSTGIPGLDNVLCGGVDAERLYLVEGEPGTGKTTLGLQFLLEGARRGEKGLYVTLSESERELRLVAKRHGFSLDIRYGRGRACPHSSSCTAATTCAVARSIRSPHRHAQGRAAGYSIRGPAPERRHLGCNFCLKALAAERKAFMSPSRKANGSSVL